jgi:hypothetical protein
MKQKSDETRAQGVFCVAKVGLNSWESQKWVISGFAQLCLFFCVCKNALFGGFLQKLTKKEAKLLTIFLPKKKDIVCCSDRHLIYQINVLLIKFQKHYNISKNIKFFFAKTAATELKYNRFCVFRRKRIFIFCNQEV